MSTISPTIEVATAELNSRCSFELSNRDFVSLPYVSLDEIRLDYNEGGVKVLSLIYNNKLLQIKGYKLEDVYPFFHNHSISSVMITSGEARISQNEREKISFASSVDLFSIKEEEE